MKKNNVLLMILDGYGIRQNKDNNAAIQAKTPFLNKVKAEEPMTELDCHGNEVGLPEGVMGNSEVGHLNIGAGRVVMQDLVRIDLALKDGTCRNIPEYKDLIKYALDNDAPVHLMGLMSDAGVHSNYNHLMKMLLSLKEAGIKEAYVHALMDGRDTPPNSGAAYLEKLIEFMNENKFGKIATVIGRYYAMDRDKRWERVEKAYNALVRGEGIKRDDPVATVKEFYAKNITDEFMEAIIVEEEGRMKDGDAVLTFNFRADRVREISIALNDKTFKEFDTDDINLHYVTLTQYQEDFPYPVLFKPQKMDKIFGEIVSKAGLTQLRIAETEKYAHVTYFFNGGEEQQYPGEERILIPSPKVATYDLQPEMSAPEVTEALLKAIEAEKFNAVVLNFANGDMVGHTGVLPAAVKALEYLDTAIEKIVTAFTKKGGTVFITADHGNCEQMWDDENMQPHTQHTLNKVPFIAIDPNKNIKELLTGGKLSDIAPTLLDVLGINKPVEMTGKSLIVR
jgi:2,3-bisphosphoglycerate-independent phosphoglycerate mutase